MTVVGRNCKSREGIRVHRVASLDQPDRGSKNGIPVTSPARSLLDYAASAMPAELERTVTEAYALKLVTEGQIRDAITRAPGRAGVGALRAELRRKGGPRWTRSMAEAKLLALLRQAGLPEPLTNARAAGFEADLLWAEQKLIVEVDGYQFHSHRTAFERDRKRDAAHVLAGYRVIRVTWRQLVDEPLAVVATIARALGATVGRSAS